MKETQETVYYIVEIGSSFYSFARLDRCMKPLLFSMKSRHVLHMPFLPYSCMKILIEKLCDSDFPHQQQ